MSRAKIEKLISKMVEFSEMKSLMTPLFITVEIHLMCLSDLYGRIDSAQFMMATKTILQAEYPVPSPPSKTKNGLENEQSKK